MTSIVRDKRGRKPFGFEFIAPLALGTMLNPINSSMLSTALVPIALSLHASVADTGWLIASLYLTSAVAQPTMGRLADLFGPRRVYLTAVIFVAVAGVFGQVASSLASLVVVRVLLGIGTSAAYPASMRIFRQEAERIGAEPPRIAMGILSLVAISTVAAGPLLGGLLTGAFGWRSIFMVNVPLSLLAGALILLWIPKDEASPGSLGGLAQQMDLVGIGLFTVFLLCLMTFLMNVSHPIWLALLGAVVFGAALITHSLKRSQPFIDVRMLARNRPLTLTYLRAGVVSMMTYCIFYGFAQWLQTAGGFSAPKAGLATLPMSLVAAVSSLTGARTKGLRAPFLISIGAALVGSICLFLVDSRTSVWIISMAVMFFGVPQGMFNTATQAAVYIQAPPKEIGTAAGLQRTAQYIGPIVAASLLAFMFGQRATDHGMHSLVVVTGALSAVLFIATLFDRTIPNGDTITSRSPKGNNHVSDTTR
jgi:MFS family permease